MILDIALGKSRRQRNWLNKKMAWSELVLKLSTTHRTVETYLQYVNATKERQAEIKDVGGFVGGYLTGGRRTPVTNVAHRQLITLDKDFGEENLWDDFTFVYDVEALVYSTHKHSPEQPRQRLVIPLDRPVSREEYEAISRKIADSLGMHFFDSTTFQPQRLMYWPSTSSDGEYFYKYQESGKFLKADDILAGYTNWQDMSEWPMTEAEDIHVRTDVKKLGNSYEKPGLVGAFCRAFDVQGAVDNFIPEVYEVLGDDRMTFNGGTTAAGVVVYAHGMYAYSHHSSDPAHGKLLNSFDLVRVHKFGHLDKDPEATMSKLQSYKAMCEYVSTLAAVISEIGVFDEPIPKEVSPDSWMSNLTVNYLGKYELTIDNLTLIIGNDELLKNKIKYNSFENNIFVLQPVPWDDEISKPRPFTDSDDAGIRHYIERVYKIFHTGKTFDAINIVALKNSYHPIKEYLDGLVWDGVARLEMLLIRYMGAEDSDYIRTVTRKAFVAPVARVYRPGIKYDYVLVMVGAQGIRKSTLLKKMGGEWFSESFTTVQGKEAYEQLQGSWIIEIAELSGFKKAEAETVKHFISKSEDKFRVAYGKRNETFPRQCAFFGSTNELLFLKDYTGNRRFWPVLVTGPVSKKYILEELPIDQLWAEAKYYFENGEALYLDDKSVEIEAKKIQSGHAEMDDRIGVVERYLNTLLPTNWDKMSKFERKSYLSVDEDIKEKGVVVRDVVCVAEIWCEVFGKDFGDMNTANTKYIHQILSQIPGWAKSDILKTFAHYGRQRCYIYSGVLELV